MNMMRANGPFAANGRTRCAGNCLNLDAWDGRMNMMRANGPFAANGRTREIV